MKLLTKKQKLTLDKSKTYLLACSGGPDSTALFHMLFKEGYKFDVAFVNYKTRPESDLEQELVQKYCDNCHTFCHILEKKCSSAGNFENEARNIRYTFFHQIYLNTQKYDAILVAHNADDLIETFVMQAERGILPDAYGLTFESSYAGAKILRPLLRYEKEFLTKYCLKNNVPFSIDSSNNDTKYKRNKIRKEYISKLSFEEKNKIVHEISKKNDEIRRDKIKFENNINSCFAKVFTKNMQVLQRFCFYFVKKQGNYMLSSAYKNMLEDIVNDRFNQIYKFNKFSIVFDSEGLTFLKKNPDRIKYTFTKNEFNKIGTCNFEDDVIIKPLKEFEFLMVNGHKKKVNRFFIDCKMPLSLRLVWPCVVSKTGEVLYSPRYRKNYKITENSKLIFDTKTLQNLTIF